VSKRILFPLLVLLLLAGGCRSEKYVTALEAYERVRPVMRLWHKDAIVLDIRSAWPEKSDWGVCADGTARMWIFAIASPGASKQTEIWLKDGRVVQIGMDIMNGQVPYSPADTSREPPDVLPVAEMLDSGEAAAIALQAGAAISDTLYKMRITRYDECREGLTERDISPAWVLTYGTDPYDFDQQQRVIIDVVTGEVICNEFAPQSAPARRLRR
jgi:hypothetical protein